MPLESSALLFLTPRADARSGTDLMEPSPGHSGSHWNGEHLRHPHIYRMFGSIGRESLGVLGPVSGCLQAMSRRPETQLTCFFRLEISG